MKYYDLEKFYLSTKDGNGNKAFKNCEYLDDCGVFETYLIKRFTNVEDAFNEFNKYRADIDKRSDGPVKYYEHTCYQIAEKEFYINEDGEEVEDFDADERIIAYSIKDLQEDL